MNKQFVLFFSAAVCFLIGHILRVERFNLLTQKSVLTSKARILMSLNLSYLANYLLPFRIGEIIRLIATTPKISVRNILVVAPLLLLERMLDLICLFTLTTAFYVYSQNVLLLDLSRQFIIGIITLSALIIVLINQKSQTKKMIGRLLSLFENKIQVDIMESLFIASNSFKNKFRTIKRRRFIILTVCMWFFYASSTTILSRTVNEETDRFEFWWAKIFSINTNYWQSGSVLYPETSQSYQLLVITISIAMFVLWIPFRRFHVNRDYDANPFNQSELQFVNEREKGIFFAGYFTGVSTDFCNSYLAVNTGHAILLDTSGSSGAKTALVSSGLKKNFRKYDSQSGITILKDQVKKIEKGKNLRYVEIMKTYDLPDFFAYDMKYDPYFISFSEYLRYREGESLIGDIEKFCTEYMRNSILKDTHSRNQEYQRTDPNRYAIEYLLGRANMRIHLIDEIAEHFNLDREKDIVCNGRNLRSLSWLKNYVSNIGIEQLMKKSPTHYFIHGDLTPENIIVNVHDASNYYLIDPDPYIEQGQVSIDFAKFLNFFMQDFDRLASVSMRLSSINSIDIDVRHLSRYRQVRNAVSKTLAISSDENVDMTFKNLQIIHTLRVLPYKKMEERVRMLIMLLMEIDREN